MTNLKGKTILVVDDEEDLRQVICDQLELRGATVFQKSNGIEALALLDTQAIDIVVSDIRMPGEGADGVTFLKKFKVKFPNRPPFIFMTGYSDYGNDYLTSLGACAIFSKPFGLSDLEEKVAFCLGMGI